MSLFNIGLSGVSLKSEVKPGDKFLINEVIGWTTSMKAVRTAVYEYDKEVPLAIAVLEQHLGCIMNENMLEDEIVEGINDSNEI